MSCGMFCAGPSQMLCGPCSGSIQGLFSPGMTGGTLSFAQAAQNLLKCCHASCAHGREMFNSAKIYSSMKAHWPGPGGAGVRRRPVRAPDCDGSQAAFGFVQGAARSRGMTFRGTCMSGQCGEPGIALGIIRAGEARRGGRCGAVHARFFYVPARLPRTVRQGPGKGAGPWRARPAAAAAHVCAAAPVVAAIPLRNAIAAAPNRPGLRAGR